MCRIETHRILLEKFARNAALNMMKIVTVVPSVGTYMLNK